MASRVNKIKKTPATMEEVMDRFITWKKANGISEQTLLDYTTHIQLLYKRYPEARNSYDELENAVCEHLSQEGIKPATYNNRLVYLQTFFKWCCEHRVLEDNPLDGFKKPRTKADPLPSMKRCWPD